MASAQVDTDETTEPTRTSECVEQRRAGASPLEHRLWDAIDEVPDPHLPVSLVEMAMIYDVEANGGHVTVQMTYPCMGCPAYDMIQNDIRSCLQIVEEVESVDVEVVWDPVWSKDMLTETVREKLRESGISL